MLFKRIISVFFINESELNVSVIDYEIISVYGMRDGTLLLVNWICLIKKANTMYDMGFYLYFACEKLCVCFLRLIWL